MYMKLTIDGTDLPSPTKVSISREQLWSSNTGRSVTTGTMLGAVIAEKRTLDVEWTNLTSKEYFDLLDLLPKGFFGPVKYQTSGGSSNVTMDKAYRGSVTCEEGGCYGGVHYYSSVKITIIEK